MTIKSLMLGSAAAIAFAAAAETGSAAVDTAPGAGENTPVTDKKSIVPQGWKTKNDSLAQFIDGQCSGKDGFEYPAFFQLCRANGLDEAKVAHYSALVDSKAHGSQGRAKMTLRNMLATIARKNGKLIGLDGAEVALDLPKPALTGAAAKAQETAAAAATTEDSASAPSETEVEVAETEVDDATE